MEWLQLGKRSARAEAHDWDTKPLQREGVMLTQQKGLANANESAHDGCSTSGNIHVGRIE